MRKNILICSILSIGLALSVYSQEGKPESGGHPKPPKEALDACVGKTAGASCEFSGRNQEKVTGTCFQPNTNLPLACRPANMPAKTGSGDKSRY